MCYCTVIFRGSNSGSIGLVIFLNFTPILKSVCTRQLGSISQLKWPPKGTVLQIPSHFFGNEILNTKKKKEIQNHLCVIPFWVNCMLSSASL